VTGVFHQIAYLLQNDPALVGGLLLVGTSQLFALVIHFKMNSIGDKSYSLFKPINDALWELPLAYMRVRSQHRWSPWPVYLMASCLACGIALFVVGLFRL
jgi:hypothetical protein